jgi:prepilin-type N-terminal cleavage/methylation domain-containing protein
MNPQRERPAARGFSLLELLLTLAILLVLMAMLYGSGSRRAQSQRKAACQKNLQTIYVALQIYAGDFEGRFPERRGARSSEEPLSLLVPKYTSVTEPFICPGSADERLPEAEPFDQRKISYAYYMGRHATNLAEALMTDRQIRTEARTRGAPLFSTNGQGPGSNHNKYGGNVMFSDGRIEMVPPHVPFAMPLATGIVLLNPKP